MMIKSLVMLYKRYKSAKFLDKHLRTHKHRNIMVYSLTDGAQSKILEIISKIGNINLNIGNNQSPVINHSDVTQVYTLNSIPFDRETRYADFVLTQSGPSAFKITKSRHLTKGLTIYV